MPSIFRDHAEEISALRATMAAERAERFRVVYAPALAHYVVDCGGWRLVPTVWRPTGAPYIDGDYDGAIRATQVCEVLQRIFTPEPE